MYIVFYCCVFLLKFHLYDAVDLNITVNDDKQTFSVYENEFPVVLKIYDIDTNRQDTECRGYCSINRRQKLRTICNLPGSQYLNVLIDRRATMIYTGRWICSFRASGDELELPPKKYNIQFTMIVKAFDTSMFPDETLPNSSPTSTESMQNPLRPQEPLQNSNIQPKEVDFNITSPETVYNVTFKEGEEQVVKMTISGIKEQFGDGRCEGWCDIKGKTKFGANCTAIVGNILHVELTPIKMTQAHSGDWVCTFHLPPKDSNTNTVVYVQKLSISVKGPDPEPDKWIFIGAGITLIVLIIIGQTICILYFKAKAKKAEIVKNLTPTKSSSDADMRYVKSNKGSDDIVRESGIYEALDTVTGRAPIPPPLATLPVSTNPLSRSVSSQHLAARTEGWQSSTNTRPPKNNQRKFNTIDKVTSLERIKNRPPLPLPTPEEIYEVMTHGASPEPKKTSRFKKSKPEQSPLLTRQQMPPLFGQSLPKTPVQNQRVPNSPTPGRKPPIGPPGTVLPSPGPNCKPMMPPGHPSQDYLVRPPMGLGQLPGLGGRAPTGAMPVMGAMPVLPSMLSTPKLKPVKHTGGDTVEEPPRKTPGSGFRMPQADGPRMTPGGFRMPPADGPRMTPGGEFRMPQTDGPRMTPGEGFRMPPADGLRTTPGEGFRMPQADGPRFTPGGPRMLPGEPLRTPGDNTRMTPAQSFNNIAKSAPVPPFKPKPPMPVPNQDKIGPSEDPESYYGSSDEEFDCYDVLPEYRIYGNAPPKKLN